MTRLTNDTRGAIVTALIHHTFDDEVRVICDEREGIANDVYNLHYARDLKRMEALPKGWLPTDSDVQFEAAGSNYTLQFSGKLYGFRYTQRAENELCDFPSNQRDQVSHIFKYSEYNRTVAVFDAHSDIATRVELHRAAIESLSERIVTARKTAAATLAQYTTVEKLIEAWPEIEPFVPKAVAPPPSLPALPTAHLNALFGLPVTEESA